MTKEQQLYLSLCAEIPNMIIHGDGELGIDRNDDETLSIFVRSDGNIDVMILDENEEEIGGGVIITTDYDELMREPQWKHSDLQKLIQDKIDFAYELCFTY